MPHSKNDLETIAVIEEIHNLVDEELVRDLGAWLNARPHMKNVVVAATLAYFVTDAIVECSESHKEICTMTKAYADYIHQTAHWSFDEKLKEGNEKKH